MACHGLTGPAHGAHGEGEAGGAVHHHGAGAPDHHEGPHGAGASGVGSSLDCYVTVLLAFGLGAVAWALLGGKVLAATALWPRRFVVTLPPQPSPPRAPTLALLQVFRL